MRCIKLMKSVNLIFHENPSCLAFFMCAIMFASKIWFRMAHKIFCLKILVGPPPVALTLIYLPIGDWGDVVSFSTSEFKGLRT